MEFSFVSAFGDNYVMAFLNVTLYLHCIGLIVQYNPNTQHVEWSCFSTDEESERGEKLGQELRKYRLGVVFTIFIIGLYWDTEGARLTPG